MKQAISGHVLMWVAIMAFIWGTIGLLGGCPAEAQSNQPLIEGQSEPDPLPIPTGVITLDVELDLRYLTIENVTAGEDNTNVWLPVVGAVLLEIKDIPLSDQTHGRWITSGRPTVWSIAEQIGSVRCFLVEIGEIDSDIIWLGARVRRNNTAGPWNASNWCSIRLKPGKPKQRG